MRIDDIFANNQLNILVFTKIHVIKSKKWNSTY